METARILIVDDEPEFRAGMRAVLEDRGYTVVGAPNGRRALHYLTSDEVPPDLILLDLNMPEMTGWELVSILARYTRLAGIPVIVVSGLTEHLHRLRELIAESLQKPVATEDLLTSVARQLERCEQKKRLAPADRF